VQSNSGIKNEKGNLPVAVLIICAFGFGCSIFSLVLFCVEGSLCDGVRRGSMGESEGKEVWL